MRKSEMGEEEDCKIIVMYDEEAPERFGTPKNRASDKMVAKKFQCQ
jgi:hypothetical protein